MPVHCSYGNPFPPLEGPRSKIPDLSAETHQLKPATTGDYHSLGFYLSGISRFLCLAQDSGFCIFYFFFGDLETHMETWRHGDWKMENQNRNRGLPREIEHQIYDRSRTGDTDSGVVSHIISRPDNRRCLPVGNPMSGFTPIPPPFPFPFPSNLHILTHPFVDLSAHLHLIHLQLATRQAKCGKNID